MKVLLLLVILMNMSSEAILSVKYLSTEATIVLKMPTKMDAFKMVKNCNFLFVGFSAHDAHK